jgi:hypothetical protein
MKEKIIAILDKYGCPGSGSVEGIDFSKVADEILLLIKPKKGQFIPPTQEQAKQFFMDNGYHPQGGLDAWNYYNDMEPAWHDNNGKPVKSWRSKFRAVWFKNAIKIQANNNGMIR